ncbi:MAG TPA: hypothetical protein VJN44_18600, partial [Roseateles sp.]|nr:hypothetical protein [Roseateles sp.]
VRAAAALAATPRPQGTRRSDLAADPAQQPPPALGPCTEAMAALGLCTRNDNTQNNTQRP